MNSNWDEAQIHAYVDGQLDALSAARLEADSRADGRLAARVARQRELSLRLQSGFDAVLDEPVPQRLLDAMSAGMHKAQVIALDTVRRTAAVPARPAWSPRELGAMAATLVVGTLLGALLFRLPGGLPMQTVDGRLVARGELDAALSTQPGGSAAADTPGIGLSFRAANGAWCRTFSLRNGSAGLACRHQDRWAVQLLEAGAAGPADATGGFRQAASPLSPALLGAIGALGAGDALTPEQEQEQLRAGWKPATP